MTPTSRCMSGITRVITRPNSGHLERYNVTQVLSPDADTRAVPEHPTGFSRESDFSRSNISKGPFESFTVDSRVPLNTEVNIRRCTIPAPRTDVSLIGRSALQPSPASYQTRGFHTSPSASYDSTSYNVADVPDFFIKYKQHRSTSLTEAYGHENEALGLMPPLTHSILSGDVVASTRRLQAKIPVEHQVAEGHTVHPSGFVVPGPGHTSTSDVARAKEKERNENIDRAIQTAAVAHRVLESDFEQVAATTLPSSHKVPFEVREPDGTIKHPSGFVPPTPAHKFRYPVNMIRDRKVSAARPRPRQPSPARAVLRAIHTAVPKEP